MIKIFYNKLMFLLLVTPLVMIFTFSAKSENQSFTISNPEVFKRNKPSCRRLGNVYDACQWMTRFVVKNTGKAKITNFCFKLRVNKKVFELCYGDRKKISIAQKDKMTFLLNLTEMMNISIEDERPMVKVFLKN
ncbi:MAG: hypothetical protein CFH34_01345 [Alphaproteobacteria bacterium MarineAlpha9_Bin4]|nr:hypothetical protein [Pelagibacterales bacterium]PPR25655.1 MAG: hypothetical protein CFH34_01345 [Alphaproteobacteria bacterium MarineAlpha9_Bin4]|tara:strand:+ start:1124 stop:1525 length:402 start_codon:yes stop_codon:yes gene_type:complete